MDRKTLDRLLAGAGAVVALVLLVCAALLTWAHVYIHDQVRNQLSAQRIYFPPKGSDALASKDIGPYLNQYAGQQLVNGAQAKAYADHFIAVHLREMTGGKTYAQLSTQSLADPANTKLAAEVQTVFRGETLRGLLLNAYAFDTMGDLALTAAIVLYVGAAAMAVLAALGLWHARRIHTKAPPAVGPALERID